MAETASPFQPERLLHSIAYRGAKFTEQFETLKTHLEDLQKQKANKTASAIDVYDAELAMQEFVGVHDNAGAYKSEYFGADISRELDNRVGGLETNAEGHLVAQEHDQQSHYVMVSATELDRVNDEGGHDDGNTALGNTVKAIEQAVRTQWEKAGRADATLNASYDIYRLRGSDFMVRLNTGMSGEKSDALVQATEEQIRLTATSVAEGKEGVPLTAVSLRLDRAMDIFNRIQNHLTEPDKATGKDVKRLLMEAIKRGTEFSSEVERLRTNLWRGVMKKGGGDENAKGFFDRYIAKGFEGTALANFDQLDLNRSTDELHEQLNDVAIGVVAQAFARERETAKETEAILLDAVSQRPLPEIQRFSESERNKLASYETVPAAELSNRQARTKGNNELAAFRRQLNAVKESATADSVQKLVERYGFLPENIQVDYDNSSERAKALQLVERRFRIEQNSIDGLTGLANRGVYYRELKEQYVKAEKEDTDVRVFFIDMAFLKYFNQQGGREVGNFAIQTAAELLEQAVETSGINNARVYRYAGDEFTITFSGDLKQEETLLEIIEATRHNHGAISRSDASADLYRPETLQFNYGAVDKVTTNEVLQSLIAKGAIDAKLFATDEAYRLEHTVDVATRLADAGVEADKAFSRLAFLIERLKQPAEKGSLEEAQTDALIRYSQKAVFGMNANALRALGVECNAGRTNLRSFVAERLEQKHTKQHDQREVLNQVIESFVRERHLRKRILELEQSLTEESVDKELLQKKVVDLQLQIETLLQARAHIQAKP